jgi:hypothetical protein
MTHPTIRLLLRVFFAAGTRLPSRCLATKWKIHIQTHRLMWRVYEVRRWDGLRWHDICKILIKIGLDIHKLVGGIHFLCSPCRIKERKRLVLSITSCFNIILPSTPRSSKWSVLLRFPAKILYTFLIFFMPTKFSLTLWHDAWKPEYRNQSSC